MPKTINQVAQEVITGKFGNGDARKARLIAAGYDYTAVQNEVNRILKGETTTSTEATENITIDVDLSKVKSVTLNFKG